MKFPHAALVATMMAGPAFAGGMAEPIIEPEVIVEDTSSSAGGIIIPLLLLILVAAAISSSSGGGGGTPYPNG